MRACVRVRTHECMSARAGCVPDDEAYSDDDDHDDKGDRNDRDFARKQPARVVEHAARIVVRRRLGEDAEDRRPRVERDGVPHAWRTCVYARDVVRACGAVRCACASASACMCVPARVLACARVYVRM
jgi:hypothetical protein